MLVEVINTTKSKIDLSLVKRVAEKFLRTHGKKNQELSIVFVSDREIKKVNYRYRGINKPTDVLSFEGDKEKLFMNNNFFGEILINYQQIKRQAKERMIPIKEELVFILVHGLIHLLGHDDKTAKQAKEMENLGNKFIRKIDKICL